MITVVIIASDKRADLLRDFFQPLLKAQISVDSDYEQGLKSVFDKRPALVFIQGEINGVSGGAVAKQIKGLLRDAAPRIVLMGDAASLKEKARSWYDDSLNFSVTDEELVTVFREQLTRHLPGVLQEAPALSADISEEQAGSGRNAAESGASVYSGDAPTLATPSVAPSGPEPVRFRVAESSSLNLTEAAIPTPVPVAGARVIATAGNADAVSSLAEIPPAARPTAARPAPPAQPLPAAKPQKPAFPEPSVSTQETTPVEPFFPARVASRHNPWLYIGGLAVAVFLAALAYYFTHPSRNGQTKPAVSVGPKAQAPQLPAAHPETGARIARLPEIISLSGRDPGYETHNPGWSRYAGSGMEFKVFRDKGEIKAIQAIAAGAQSLPEDMPKRVVGQIFGYASYSSAAPVEKQNYLVQQSRLPGGAEMLVYRKKSTNGIRGIVISVP